ncbi:MAG TPA: MerR family transcriptional regulator [Acidimicrobiales bacterium]|nr:MerR family transcriptional regulator [Acidimicrobiales bacterium]
MRIAEVAERSGFSPATLRYYEELDLLPAPARTPAGYRTYDPPVLDRLAFIGRAKSLGCTLDEVAELMPHWDGRRCAPMQARLRELAATKLDQARTATARLSAFTSDLERVLAGLGRHTPEGPCDEDCGCVRQPAGCTLDPEELPGRIREWRQLDAHVTARTQIEGGLRLRLDAATPLGDLAELVAAEQSCCGFFAFALTVDSDGRALEVRGPAEAVALFG